MADALPLLTIDKLRTPLIGPFSLALAPGECAILSGPSGVGKSLLLRAIADLDPNQGEVWLGDTERSTMPAPQWRRQVGYLPATSGWWAERVGDHGLTSASPYLTRLGFAAEVVDWPIARLSSGERQRLALVRLLANDPHVVLLDEPTANLDPRLTATVEACLTDYLRQHTAAALWVSHDRDQQQRLADRAWVMTSAAQLEPATLQAPAA